MSETLLKITEEQFYDEYCPQKNHLDDNASFNGCMYETYGDEIKHVRDTARVGNRVWTIIEDDEGHLWLTLGIRFVNRFGFLVTEKAVVGDCEDIRLD